ncbi:MULTISPECIES: sterol-binding protein [Burkholderiaceae]|uniref:ubiquinone biosynthesis accessory factor UbiJ n=1 Tax=Burkholderiaceae TaxID=119060 RepID=UPI00095F7698|nr:MULTISPECIES: sterol-binding protein [Burkholderiaceae]MCG1040231.1 sterol-binding protein [Mycetohabitans sp. B7]SIT73287.1 ubiquinone biosynthesis protein UbiJ [Burkholderia sp. b14]
MTIAAKPFVAVVNHLLIREAWARERLLPYAGKTARLVLSPAVLELAVQGDGTVAVRQRPPAGATALAPAASGGACDVRAKAPHAARDGASASHAPMPPTVDVTITVPPSALSAFTAGGQAAILKHVRIEGDAEFAATIAKLAEHLRWEAEEDLARLIGDVPAHRIASVARAVSAYARRAAGGLVGSLTEYLLDENPQLVRRARFEQFGDELARARDTLARIEKRIERAECGVATRPGGAASSTGARSRSADDLH